MTLIAALKSKISTQLDLWQKQFSAERAKLATEIAKLKNRNSTSMLKARAEREFKRNTQKIQDRLEEVKTRARERLSSK